MAFHHAFAGLTFVELMTECRPALTADELSRGKAFWRNQKRRARAAWYRTSGDDKLQAILDFEFKCDQAINRCPTTAPCSRTIFLPQAA